MAFAQQIVARAIDEAPLNRGLRGSDWLARPGNIPVIFDDEDVVLFDDEGGDIFQVHVLMESRGRKAIGRIREAFAMMFQFRGASLIFGMVPAIRPDVALMARWVGMRSSGLRDTLHGPCELFVLSRAQWKVADQ